jgi:Ca2+-binding RTX toxin-like protein
VFLSVAGAFSAAGWTFATWSSDSIVSIEGTSGVDTITGSAQVDVIVGGAGADILDGGAGNDIFQVAGFAVAPGEQIIGGGGVLDVIRIFDDVDLAGVTITGVERLEITGATATFLDNFAFTSVVDSGGEVALAVGVSSGNADLSGVAFANWGLQNTITINGSAGVNTLTGSDEIDTVNGGDGADTIIGGAGADNLNGGDGDDTFDYLTTSDLVAGESLNGGNGTDLIRVNDNIFPNFRTATLASIEALLLNPGAFALLSGTQIGAGAITAVTGSGSDIESLSVLGSSVDLSAVTFTTWDSNDRVVIQGTAGADTITGSSQNDTIALEGGADLANGGGGDDGFVVKGQDGSVAGAVLGGGAGTDTLLFDATNLIDFDFSTTTLTDIEILRLEPSLGATVRFSGSQIGGGAIGTVDRAGGGSENLIVSGQSVNLSGVAFLNWAANDTITLNGTAGDDNLAGSGQSDAINGGTGSDTAIFSGNRSSYTLQVVGNTIVISGLDGTDTLSAIERLQFAGGTVNLVDDGSALFDTPFYLDHSPDVFQAGVDALFHYNVFGFHEGRDPNAWFDTSGYLAVNPDVAAAGINPLDHFHQFGWAEGRDPSADFDTRLYLINNPDVAAAGIDPLEHFLQVGSSEGRQAFAAIGQNIAGGFDAEFYLFHNPDVAAAGIDPWLHYNVAGRFEGRNPNAWFDTAGYLSHYTDVAAAGINPLLHYEVFGWTEGRDPHAGFDTLGYLAANPDVAAAHINPLDHFLQFGIYEGRAAINDGLFH